MQRKVYGGLLLAMVAIGIVWFSYRSVQPIASAPPVAEFGGVSLRIEYAVTPAQRELGLGGRKSIPNNYGMLFIFPKDDRYGFWMKATLVPLDPFWLNDKGQVVSISQNVQPSSFPNVFYPSAPALYVLETAAGFAQEHDILLGTPLLLKNIPSVSK